MSKRARTDEGCPSITVMMNGLPGAMGHEVAQACLRRGFSLSDAAMTGPGMPAECEVVEGTQRAKVKLVGPSEEGAQRRVLDEAKARYGDGLVVIDFTHPSAVNANANLYGAAGVPFVMGTTGGDRDALQKGTEESGVYAVIAPNMSKQIVALQATMAHMSTNFPGAFSGYRMELVESHQKTKADTSGTAKDMVKSFQGLGLDFSVEDIKQLRDDEASQAFGVPRKALDGHAFHTYTLTSSDGSVQFQFAHNVTGRRTYGEGAADAVKFLAGRRSAGDRKKVFSMVDVLAAGAMR